MNFNFVRAVLYTPPTLQKLTLQKITIEICKESLSKDWKDYINFFNESYMHTGCEDSKEKSFICITGCSINDLDEQDDSEISWAWTREIEESTGLLLKMDLLKMPAILVNQVKSLTKLIACQVISWVVYDKEKVFINLKSRSIDKIETQLIKPLEWTVYGTISIKQTVLHFILNDDFSLIERFILACRYCWGEHIFKLYSQMSHEQKMWLETKQDSLDRLVTYWIHKVKGRLIEMENLAFGSESLHEAIVMRNVICLNEAAVQHFWMELTEEEQNRMVLPCARICLKNNTLSHNERIIKKYLLVFFMSYMSSNQLVLILNTEIVRPYALSVCYRILRNWPWQELFMPLARLSLSFFNAHQYVGLWKGAVDALDIPFSKNKSYHENVLEILKDLWNESPALLRSHLLEQVECHQRVFKMFLLDKEFSESFFGNYSPKFLKCTLHSEFGLMEVSRLIRKEKWDVIEVCFQRGLPEVKERKAFQKFFMDEKGLDIATCLVIKDKWHVFEDLLTWNNCATFKRNLVEKNNGELPMSGLTKYNRQSLDLVTRILKSCLESEEEITRFKEEVLAVERVSQIIALCIDLIKRGQFEETKKVGSFFFPSTEKLKEFKNEYLLSHPCSRLKQQIEETFLYFHLNNPGQEEKMLEILFDSEEEKKEFKRDFFSHKRNETLKRSCICIIKEENYKQLESILSKTFCPEELAIFIKEVLMPDLQNILIETCLASLKAFLLDYETVEKLLIFCLETVEEVAGFKRKVLLDQNKHIVEFTCIDVISSGHMATAKKTFDFIFPTQDDMITFLVEERAELLAVSLISLLEKSYFKMEEISCFFIELCLPNQRVMESFETVFKEMLDSDEEMPEVDQNMCQIFLTILKSRYH